MKIDFSKTGKELFDQLFANKTEIIAQKRSVVHKSDGVRGMPEFAVIEADGAVRKTLIGDIPKTADSIKVTFVANTAYWMDSQDDVLLPGNWDRSIKDKKGRLHLKDHDYTLDSQVGVVSLIYKREIPLTDFGLNLPGVAEGLIYDSDVKKLYDGKTFEKYKTGQIQQHSIGMMYVRLTLAMNSQDEYHKDEYAEWLKHIDKIINKEDAIARGYFFPVYEIKLIEASAVLAGANELTPTLEVKSVTFDAPPSSTIQEPSKEKIDWGKLIADKQLLKTVN